MKKLIYLLPVLFLVFSCEKDAEAPNDEELITTLQVDFTNNQTAEVKTLLFRDLDGDGGTAPVITTDDLEANATYSVTISLLNETESPAENITIEVEEEGEEHQFFFEVSSNLNLDVSYNDSDVSSRPIGIVNTATTGGASSGTFKVVLRHEPNKAAANVSNGDITNAGGETDIEVVFDVSIQ